MSENIFIDTNMIVASALEHECRMLYSEDFQNGLIIDKNLMVKNPFYVENPPTKTKDTKST